jgi:hypothetical protein
MHPVWNADAGVHQHHQANLLIFANSSGCVMRAASGLLLQGLGRSMRALSHLRTLPAFGHSIARRSLDEVPSS